MGATNKPIPLIHVWATKPAMSLTVPPSYGENIPASVHLRGQASPVELGEYVQGLSRLAGGDERKGAIRKGAAEKAMYVPVRDDEGPGPIDARSYIPDAAEIDGAEQWRQAIGFVHDCPFSRRRRRKSSFRLPLEPLRCLSPTLSPCHLRSQAPCQSCQRLPALSGTPSSSRVFSSASRTGER